MGRLREILKSLQKLLRARITDQTLYALMSEHPNRNKLMNVFAGNFFRTHIEPDVQECPRGSRILVFAPHQDDETIGACGTLLKAAALNKKITCIYITDGAKGLSERGKNRSLYNTRHQEAKDVWKKLNGSEPVFLDLPCGNIPVQESTVSAVVDVIEKYKPDTIFLPFFLDPAIDHQRTCELIANALKHSKLPEATEVWSYQVKSIGTPNVIVDVTEMADKKFELNTLWKSQNKTFDYTTYARAKDITNGMYVSKTNRPELHRPDANEYHIELFYVCPVPTYLELHESIHHNKK